MAKPIISITGAEALVRPGSPEKSRIWRDGTVSVTDKLWPYRRVKEHRTNVGADAIVAMWRQSHDDGSKSTVVDIVQNSKTTPWPTRLTLQEYDYNRGDIWLVMRFRDSDNRQQIAMTVVRMDPTGAAQWHALCAAMRQQPAHTCRLSDLNI